MATKKESTNKKTTTKKAATKKTTKKVAKEEKVAIITEEQLSSLEDVENTIEEKKIDWGKYKVNEGEYNLTNALKEDVVSAFKEMKPEDKIFVVKEPLKKDINDSIKPNKEDTEKAFKGTEVMNGDPAVLTPIEEEVEIEETPKEEKPKITKRISKMFTYLWNGQMIDF